MSDSRRFDFEIDAATWPHGPPPTALANAAATGHIELDLDAALLFLGIVTRPPELHGFSLADTWAWLRYFPSILGGPRVRLRPEWTRLDSHQKTVASDDYGVGIGTWALRSLLGFRRYADTVHVVNVLERGQWLLRRHAKRGPAKSPDYIAYDQNNEVSVVECKGTQSSRRELTNALARGRPQKQALRALRGQRLIHQLVVGVYVPQFEGSGEAVIAVHDPAKDDARKELRKYTEEDIRESTEQVSIAKEISLFGLTMTAGALVHDRYSPESVGLAVIQDVSRAREEAQVQDETVTIQREYTWRQPLVRGAQAFRGVRFRGSLPLDSLDVVRSLRRRDIPDEVLADVAEATWRDRRTDHGAEIISPLGAVYGIEWLE